MFGNELNPQITQMDADFHRSITEEDGTTVTTSPASAYVTSDSCFLSAVFVPYESKTFTGQALFSVFFYPDSQTAVGVRHAVPSPLRNLRLGLFPQAAQP